MTNKLITLLVATIMVLTNITFVSADTGESQDTGSMRVYGIFLHRLNENLDTTDKFGDAILLESQGHYLLMDTGDLHPQELEPEIEGSSLVDYLKSVGVKELDIYISHLHSDHWANIGDVCSNLKVNTVYLPDTEIAKDYITPVEKITIAQIYDILLKRVEKASPSTNIQYLSPSFREHYNDSIDTITVGDANIKVIGPVGDYSIDKLAKVEGHGRGKKEKIYLNDYSLSSIITCGNFKYLTCGDIELEEEAALISKYGSQLNSDLFKSNHHGLKTSNSEAFIKTVKPMWTFAENHGMQDISKSHINHIKVRILLSGRR